MSGRVNWRLSESKRPDPPVVKLLGTRKWPKIVPPIDPEFERIAEDFMSYWQQVLPQHFSILEHFNHSYPVKQRRRIPGIMRTLEIGAGPGEHAEYEDLSTQEYHAVELRAEFASTIKKRFPSIHVLNADCQRTLSFSAEYFDRILAIHVLEHLPELPNAVVELRRILKPDGQLCVVIPCEGGRVYSLARDLSTRRIFDKRYGLPYDWWIYREHINDPEEIMEQLERVFVIESTRYFPLRIPIMTLNLCIGLTLKAR